MSATPRGVPPGARRIGPGFYEHGGELHVDLEELVIAAGGDPTSDSDLEKALEQVAKVAGGQGIPTDVRLK